MVKNVVDFIEGFLWITLSFSILLLTIISLRLAYNILHSAAMNTADVVEKYI